MTDNYHEFINNKCHTAGNNGFDPVSVPDYLFDFQKLLLTWTVQKGRSAIFADCGLGKTPMQLVWADNIVRKENKNVLILTPLAVAQQTINESKKFGIEAHKSHDGTAYKGITVTNYEKLHYFNPDDFVGVVCDESSILKNFGGVRRKAITDFMRRQKYRLLCTATASPNDYVELGTSAEALGVMGNMDMLSMFFKTSDNALQISQRYGDFWNRNKYRFKAHSEEAFWRWVCSWARALRKPSDMGCDDNGFILPPMIVNETVCEHNLPFEGELFVKPAITLEEQRMERKLTIKQRCEAVLDKVMAHDCSLVWCQMNDEGDYLEKIIPESKQISGSDTDEEKERAFMGFLDGSIKRLITKPKIGAFGLNFQHCSHITFFPSHSFEQYYQGVRRCWRYGQKNTVNVDIITTTGEIGVLRNLQKKADASDKMFTSLVKYMNRELAVKKIDKHVRDMEAPAWL